MLDLLCLTGAPCGEGGLSNSIAIDRSSEQFLSSDAERETHLPASERCATKANDMTLRCSGRRPAIRQWNTRRGQPHACGTAAGHGLIGMILHVLGSALGCQPTEAFSLIIPRITPRCGVWPLRSLEAGLENRITDQIRPADIICPGNQIDYPRIFGFILPEVAGWIGFE